jgi:hypothetical protein
VEEGEGTQAGDAAPTAPSPEAGGSQTPEPAVAGSSPAAADADATTGPWVSDEPAEGEGGTLSWFRPSPAAAPPDPADVCRFLAGEAPDGSLGPASLGVDQANRCVAIGDPVPQSARLQQLVCLVAAHYNCPRYIRGILIESTPPPPTRREPPGRAVVAAALIFAGAVATSFGFLIVRGGFGVSLASPASSALVVAAGPTASPLATAPPTPPPTEIPTPSTSPSLLPSPSLSPSPSPTPAPPRPTPAPSSDRYALLVQCPSTPDCWIYTIRSGDNLHSIANWFGVSYDRMISMNPNLRIPIHAGDKLKIPTPTR